jgi:hypothetical protein
MTDGGDAGFVRTENRDVPGPVELDLAVDVGRVEVHLEDPATTDGGPTSGDAASGTAVSGDEAADAAERSAPAEAPAASSTAGRQVRVEIRHDLAATGGWAQRLGEVASWLGTVGAGPDAGPDSGTTAADAVRAATITWTGGTGDEPAGLAVRSSTDLRLRMVPLLVTVHAPAGSRVAARTGAGDVVVHGRAGRATVRTGAGTATAGDIDGDADITTGSGDVAVGTVAGRARIRTGSGAIRVAAFAGSTDVKAGSGDVTIGAVSADVGVRTGTGAVQVTDARSGRVELTSGSGGLRIGVHAGVLAELDLSSGSGRARSELDVQHTNPGREPALRVRGRTASGDVVVTRAAAPA